MTEERLCFRVRLLPMCCFACVFGFDMCKLKTNVLQWISHRTERLSVVYALAIRTHFNCSNPEEIRRILPCDVYQSPLAKVEMSLMRLFRLVTCFSNYWAASLTQSCQWNPFIQHSNTQSTFEHCCWSVMTDRQTFKYSRIRFIFSR